MSVHLPRDSDGYPPYEVEEIDATLLGSSQARLDGIPVFAYGIARNDVVRVVRVAGTDDTIWVESVVSPSRHSTARIVPLSPVTAGAVVARMRELGCDAHDTRFGLVAVDIPPTSDATAVRRALELGSGAGDWHFDFGVVPEELD